MVVTVQQGGVGPTEDVGPLLIQTLGRNEGRDWSHIAAAAMHDGRLEGGRVTRREIRSRGGGTGWVGTPWRLELHQCGTVTRARQDVLRGRPFAHFLHLRPLLTFASFRGGSIGVVHRVRASAGGAARLGIQVHSPPTTFSRGVVLHLDKATVQREVMPYRVLHVRKIESGAW